jgi:hypothetical protein
MKQANLAIFLALAVVVVIVKIATRNTGEKPSATGGTAVPPLGAAETDAITEAAYHQDASDFAAATGADENIGGEEVTSLQ